MTQERQSIQGFYIAFGVLFVVIALGAFTSDVRAWGFNHLRFFPLPVRVIALALVASMFVPRIGHALFDRLTEAIARFEAMSSLAVVAAAIAMVLFVAFPSATLLLGDGQLQENELRTAIAMENASTADGLRDFADKQAHARGAWFFNFLSFKFAHLLGAPNPIVGLRVAYAILGAILVFALLRYLQNSGEPPAARLLIFPSALCVGGIQLFFGYTETYTPTFFFAALCVIACTGVFRGRVSPWVPLSLFAIAVFMHAESLVLAPAMVLVSLWVLRGRPVSDMWKSSTVLAILTVIAAVIAAQISGLSRFFRPVFDSDTARGVLTPRHAIDIVNELILLVPVGLPLLATVWLVWRRRSPIDAASESGMPEAAHAAKKPHAEHDLGVQHALHGHNLPGGFALTLFVPAFVYLVFFNAELGFARDWDLFAITTFGFLMPGFVAVDRLSAAPAGPELLRRFTIPTIALAMAIAVPWVGVNSSESKSIRRFETLLAGETQLDKVAYAYEALATHQRERGRTDQAVAAFEAADRHYPNLRYRASVGRVYYEGGDIPKALEVFEQLVRDEPAYGLGRAIYLELLAQTGDINAIDKICQYGIEQLPHDPFYFFHLGMAHYTMGRLDEATAMLNACLQQQPSPNMRQTIEEVLTHIDATKQD